MQDQFARQTARNAHARIRDLEATLERLRHLAARRSVFQNRCHLCGGPTRQGSRYCHAHDWAAG